MLFPVRILLLGGLCLAAGQLQAAPRHQLHRLGHDHVAAPQNDTAPGAANRELTRRAQSEPGLTEELSPGAKQTATGGPVGGVPGFEGN